MLEERFSSSFHQFGQSFKASVPGSLKIAFIRGISETSDTDWRRSLKNRLIWRRSIRYPIDNPASKCIIQDPHPVPVVGLHHQGNYTLYWIYRVFYLVIFVDLRSWKCAISGAFRTNITTNLCFNNYQKEYQKL